MVKKDKFNKTKNSLNTKKESKTFLENKWFAIGLIVLISAVVYYNSLNVPFIFDDIFKIVENPDIRQLSNVKTKLIYPYNKERHNFRRNDPSRPLTYLTYTLNYHFGKLNTFGYHLFDLIIHTCNAILIFFLTRKIIAYTYKRQLILFPLLVSLLFVIHPISTSSVVYVYARGNVLSTFFYILSLLFFIKVFEKKQKLYFISLFCFALSLFSKPVAVTLPFMILVFDYIFLSDFNIKKIKSKKYYHIPFWIILLIYLSFRYFYFGGIGDLEQVGTTWNRYTYFVIQPYVMLRYLKLLIIPIGLCIDHTIKPAGIFEFKILASLLVFIGICILMYKMYRKKTEISKILLFCFLWFFITLSPTSSFFPAVDAMVERRIYLSGLGFCLAVVFTYFLIFRKWGAFERKHIWILYGLMGVHISVLGIATVKRNQVYQNPVLLWQDAISECHRKHRAYNNLGVVYYAQKEYKKAIQEFQKAIEINPDYAEVYNNLGVLYKDQKDYAKAIQEFQKAIEINPDYAEVYNNLGVVYYAQKNYAKAIQEFQKAIEIDPDYAGVYNNLGNLWYAQKNYAKAIQEYQKALDINPDHVEAYNNLGVVYKGQKEYTKAIQEFQKAIEINPDYAEAYYNLGITYYEQKEYSKAIREYQKAVEIKPDYTEAHNYLGFLYYAQKDYAKAIQEYQKVVEINPDYAEARKNLGALYYYQKEYKKALQEYEYFLKLNPYDENVKTIIKKLR